MDNDSVSDGRRYRRKSDGNVYRVVMQARSPDGSVILRAVEGPGEIGTTNDRLAVDYDFVRASVRDDGEAHAAQAVAAEREACLRVAMDRAAELDAASPEDYEPGEDEGDDVRYGRFAEAMEIARRIGARGKVTP